MTQWNKAVRPSQPGHPEPVSGYTDGHFFVYEEDQSWSVSRVGADGQLAKVGKLDPSGSLTCDFDSLSEAQSAVQEEDGFWFEPSDE